jgi:lipopolysaccharide/colanic/teichoic acid biosynthesis glycosyltransferase
MVDLFRDIFFQNHKKIRPLLLPENNWFSNEDMYAIFTRERNRMARSGLGLSYVIIDLTTYLDDETLVSDEAYATFLSTLLTIINENTRNYDIKFFLNPFKIGILLADTGMSKAKVFIQKISDLSYRHFRDQKLKEMIRMIHSVQIATYPVNLNEEVTRVEGTPLLVEKVLLIHPDPHSLPAHFNIYDVGDHEFTIDWTIKPRSNGTIAIGNPDFWSIFHLPRRRTAYHICKRTMDIAGALAGLLFFFPIMVVVGLAIKLTSRGPVLFKQDRLGHLGRKFKFLKFRSMRIDGDDRIHREYVTKLIKGKDGDVNLGSRDKPVFKITTDPRITRVGHFLRKTSLDELPQFFNVLTGDMSLVGPRPPIPYEINDYKNWHLRRILDIKPGITGLWQVQGRSKTTFNEMVRLDLQYVSHCTLWLDIKILLKTIRAVLNFKGAY